MPVSTFIVKTLLIIVCILSRALVDAQSLREETPWPEGYRPSFARLRDTLYILDSTYLEVRLDQQKIYQHFRSGRIDVYTCSTGDPRIKDGIATRSGIFTIQWKSRKTMSQQFQVYLNYWMQFDGGIGFHGLDSRSYYRYLGRRPSSHGCVRISNETGARLYGNVFSGTVVYVHNGSPARAIVFADSSQADLEIIYEIDEAVFKQRLDAVTSGRWYDSSLTRRLALPRRTRLRGKIGVGMADPKLIVQYPIPLASIDVSPRLPQPVLLPARPLPGIARPDRDGDTDVELSENR